MSETATKGTGLTVGQQNLNTLSAYLNKAKPQLAMAVPKHMTPERVIRVAITAVQRTPALLECSPLSICGAVMQAAELGLELSGVLGQAYLIPRNNKHTQQKEANFQIGYRGLIALAHRSGRVSSFAARIVYPTDEFKFSYGTNPHIEHVPSGDEGEWTYVYAVLIEKDGGKDFEVMSRRQVLAHRDRYALKPKYGEWVWDTALDEMAKKTVIRKLSKRAPLSIEFTTAVMADEYNEAGVMPELPLTVPMLTVESETATDALASKLGANGAASPSKPERQAEESAEDDAETSGSVEDAGSEERPPKESAATPPGTKTQSQEDANLANDEFLTGQDRIDGATTSEQLMGILSDIFASELLTTDNKTKLNARASAKQKELAAAKGATPKKEAKKPGQLFRGES